MLGLIGGHVEAVRPEPEVLEATARRELLEETGLDLTGVRLDYLESEFFLTNRGEPQVTVTFVAQALLGAEPRLAAPAELAEVGWWSLDEAAADQRCPDWLPNLLERAGRTLS
jgi:ADP-ribose pyrophosphatase YjhB (NUDIX family)